MRAVATLLVVTSLVWGGQEAIVVPVPKELLVQGKTILPADGAISYSPETQRDTAAVLSEELERLFGMHAPLLAGQSGHISLRVADQGLPAEGYRIACSRDAVSITGQDADGLFWGVMSLLQLLEGDSAGLEPAGGAVSFPRVAIRDWPDNPWRGFMLQLPYSHDPVMMRDTLRLMARWKLNHVVLEWGPRIKLDRVPRANRSPVVSKDEVRAVCDYARRRHIEPIPGLNSLGHLGRAYTLDPYTSHGGLDITREETYTEFLFPIYEDYLEAFRHVEYFHAGMDESFELFSHLHEAGADVPELFARHVTRVRDFFARRGIKLIIWSDMLLAKEQCNPNHTGAVNGGPPHNSYKALDKLPRDVIIDYWIYDPLPEFPVVQFLQEKGFRVMVSPWKSPRELTQYGTKHGTMVLGTSWVGFSYSPTSASFFSVGDTAPVMPLMAEYGWNKEAPAAPQLPYDGAEQVVDALCARPSRLPIGDSPRFIAMPEGSGDLGKLACRIAPGRHSSTGVDFDVSATPILVGEGMANEVLAEAKLPVWAHSPGREPLRIDGIDRERGAGETILYRWSAEQTHSGANVYGAEVAVSGGAVVQRSRYGSQDMAIPPGGFVLSAHAGPGAGDREGYRWLSSLQIGDTVCLLDPGNAGVPSGVIPPLTIELPAGEGLEVDGVNRARGTGRLILYNPQWGASTQTNPYGAEAAVRNGRVIALNANTGDTPIPEDGYVLSAHAGGDRAKHAALSGLKVGDRVRLLAFGKQEYVFGPPPAGASRSLALSGKAGKLVLLHATQFVSRRGTNLGQYVILRADGTQDTVPLRYGVNVCAGGALRVNGLKSPDHWVAFSAGDSGVVSGAYALCWDNESPDVPLKELRIELTGRGSLAQLALLAVTAYD